MLREDPVPLDEAIDEILEAIKKGEENAEKLDDLVKEVEEKKDEGKK